MTEDASLSDFLEDEAEAVAGDGDDAVESDGDAEDTAESDGNAGSDAEDTAEDDAESEQRDGTTPDRMDEDSSDPADSEPGDLEDADLEEAELEGIAPVRPTYAWGDDVACADCGHRVDRAWRDGDEYVCGSCKDW